MGIFSSSSTTKKSKTYLERSTRTDKTEVRRSRHPSTIPREPVRVVEPFIVEVKAEYGDNRYSIDGEEGYNPMVEEAAVMLSFPDMSGNKA